MAETTETTPPLSAGTLAAKARRINLKGRSLRGHTARGTVINGAFLVGLSVLAVLKGVVAAGFLTREDYGVWGIVSTSVLTLLALKQVGVGDKFIQQAEEDQERAFRKAFTVELIFTGSFALLILAAIPILTLVYGQSEILVPGLILALVLPAGILQAPIWVFYRRMEFFKQRALQSIDPIVGFVVTIGLAIAGVGYWSLVFGIVAGVWASGVAAFLASPYKIRLTWEPGMLREYWSFSWPLLITTMSTLVIAQGSVMVGEATVGLAGVGAITLAYTISQFSDRVDGIVTGTMYPAICAVKDRTDLLLESFVKSNRLALMWGIPFGVGLTLFAADLIDFGLGATWEPALILLQAFGLTAAFGHVGFNWHAYFRARGDTKPIAVVQVVVAVAFLALVLPLVIAWGLDGLALGTGLMTLVALIARAVALRRLFPGFAPFRHLTRAITPTIPAVAVVLGMRLVEDGRTLVTVFAELALYFAVTAVATLVFERALLREVIGYVRPREILPT